MIGYQIVLMGIFAGITAGLQVGKFFL